MKDNAADETVIDQLTLAIEQGAFPKVASDYANHLLHRLSAPVRVSVFGIPGSGKSELINMFVGRSVLSDKVRLPTTEIVYGPNEAMTLTDAKGRSHRHEKVDLSLVSSESAAFLKIELPIERLKRISFLEVVTDGSVAELSSAIEWAVGRTDIALWCSQNFEADEQAVWSKVPDSLKDHAFLVLTKADVLSAEGALSKRVSGLETIVAEEFHSLFAVATLQAIAAYGSNGEVDEATFHASGGGALTSEVLRHAERGRRADFDSAQMFLVRYKISGLVSASKTAAKDEPVDPSTELVEASPVATNADAAEVPDDAVQPEAPEVDDAPEVSNVALFADAVRYLKRRGETLTAAMSDQSEGNGSAILPQCADVVEYLMDHFSQDESGCEATDAMIDELSEAQELMVLLEVEGGDASAADAATLILQLRREIEMQIAA